MVVQYPPGFDATRERFAGGLTLVAMVAAFTLANSSLYESYWYFHHTSVSIRFGDFGIDKPLIDWINKGLMVFFFLLIGLELKREIMEGQLSDRRQIALPAFSAFGGMVVPAVIYLLINGGDQQVTRGWAIPMATDIVLALAVLSLLRGRVPGSLFIFLTALAIFDDVGAILVIAFFYPETLSVFALIAATVGVVVLIGLNRFKVTSTAPYVLVGVFLWVALLNSGVHATLAGVIVAFSIPLYGTKKEVLHSPLREMERRLRPWVALGIVPLFAFFNAGISLEGINIDVLLSPLTQGIVLGLFIGKQLGVFSMAWLAVQIGVGHLPVGVSWVHIYGVALLSGIGFTMSLFITSLAFVDEYLLTVSRFSIIVGSLISATVGLIVLNHSCNKPSTKNMANEVGKDVN